MKKMFFLLAMFFWVTCMTIPIFAADQAVPTPPLNELQGGWTGKIVFEDARHEPTDATMSVTDNNVSISFIPSISGTVTIRGRYINIIGTDSRGENWEFDLQISNEAGKTILKGAAHVKTMGGKKMISSGRSGIASFEKVGSATDKTPATK